ncbi:hypothetical protein TCDM_10548 [Trypanosoma cruzi Dm28c]|uniref:Uncharacterized protein n=1 Tax=Trypanosoma cruzi Dm28c TaxID=1416333 RepID=V5AM99_TRYCR|nr:hypothetical protein TCDM_10548 [Trypanosoma cruzi Dm28c]
MTGVAPLHRETERSKGKKEKSSEGREMLTRPTPKGAPPHEKKTRKAKQILKEKHGGRVWLCVWRCGCLPALAAIKTKQEERNVCSAPQALVVRPHVTAPSARRSSRPLLMRAAGEAHRAVVMSVSVVCEWSIWAETHGTPHRKSAEKTIEKSRK